MRGLPRTRIQREIQALNSFVDTQENSLLIDEALGAISVYRELLAGSSSVISQWRRIARREKMVALYPEESGHFNAGAWNALFALFAPERISDLYSALYAPYSTGL